MSNDPKVLASKLEEILEWAVIRDVPDEDYHDLYWIVYGTHYGHMFPEPIKEPEKVCDLKRCCQAAQTLNELGHTYKYCPACGTKCGKKLTDE